MKPKTIVGLCNIFNETKSQESYFQWRNFGKP